MSNENKIAKLVSRLHKLSCMKTEFKHNSIGYLLIQICKARRNKANEMLAKFDIHAGQDVLLTYLGQEDGQTVSNLVEKICISHATMVRMIERMESNDLIHKAKDENDMRVSRIYLTDKGKTALQEVYAVWKSLEEKTLMGISGEDQDTLRRILGNLLDNLG